MIALATGLVIAVWILFRPRFWGLYFPFWFALFPKGFVLLDQPGVPVVTMYRFIGIMLFISMTARYIAFGWRWIRGMPLLPALLLMIISAMISAIFNGTSPDAGFFGVFNLFNEIVVPVAAFCFFFSRLDFADQSAFFRRLLLFWAAIAFYATLAYLVNFNPYIEFLKTTTISGRVTVQTYAETLRGLRAQGTISHPITFGAALVLVVLGSLAVSSAGRRINLYKTGQVPRMFLYLMILVAVILTRSRSPLIMLAVAMVSVILLSTFMRAYLVTMSLAVAGGLALLFVPAVQDAALAVLNIFDPTIGPEQNGSSLDMRSVQLAVSWGFMMQAPLFGNGLDSTQNIVANGVAPELFNSESIIFSLMINQGLFGLFVYAALFILALIQQFRGVRDRNMRAIGIGLILGYAVFILATGTMETMQLFLAIHAAIIISARTVDREKS